MQDNGSNVNTASKQAPWSGLEILCAMYLVCFLWPGMFYFILKGVGLEHWYYGDEVPEMARRLELWVSTLAFPFQVLTIPLIFSSFSGTRLDQLGLTTRRFVRNVLAGVAGWLVLTAPVFGLFLLLRYLSSYSGEQTVEQHILEKIGREQLFPLEWFMLFFTAMVTAPAVEELAFRGALQPWLAERRWGGHVAMVGALMLAIWFRWHRLQEAWPEGAHSLATAGTPALFVLALLPIYLLVWRRSRTPLGPAVFGTSLFFAYIHASVWPTPVPLFVLALGLGVLAHRSGSLVGPIVLHGLFNGVSCVQLLLGW